MMKKRVKQGSAILLAFAVALSVFVLPGVWAASAIDVDRKDCSVEFSVGGEYEELNTNDLSVKLYRVASVDKAGAYTPVSDFSGLDLSALSRENKDSAAKWLERAQAAEEMVTANTAVAADTTIKNGKATVKNLETGLYLVSVEQLVTPNYVYTFTPYLISLPNNYYYQTGDDEWVYELSEVVLKPEQTPRYGSLVIDKTLRDFNATSGAQATFVFQIDITTLEGKTESRVEAMTMGAGEESQQLTIDQIPAGASVRVRETYSGASYTQVSDDPDDVTIFADEAVRVSFENAHDGRPNGGYGVKNNFKLDENKQYQYTGDNVSTD